MGTFQLNSFRSYVRMNTSDFPKNFAHPITVARTSHSLRSLALYHFTFLFRLIVYKKVYIIQYNKLQYNSDAKYGGNTIFRKKTAPPYIKVYLLNKIVQCYCTEDDQYLSWCTPEAITVAMLIGTLLKIFLRYSGVMTLQTLFAIFLIPFMQPTLVFLGI